MDNGNRASWLTHSWRDVAAIALIPIPAGWLLAFILWHAGRAQAAGFRAVAPWKELSSPKRAFVAFRGAAVTGLLSGSMVVMNRYADAAAPVSLGLKARVTNVGDDYVRASGARTRAHAVPGSSMGDPLQTFKIVCNRSERRCSESQASVGGKLFMAELIEYRIERWDSGVIVFKSVSECAVERFTIDRASESANGAGQVANSDRPLCKFREGNETRWTDRLSDGFPVYWELRSKARPLPLRLI